MYTMFLVILALVSMGEIDRMANNIMAQDVDEMDDDDDDFDESDLLVRNMFQ